MSSVVYTTLLLPVLSCGGLASEVTNLLQDRAIMALQTWLAGDTRPSAHGGDGDLTPPPLQVVSS